MLVSPGSFAAVEAYLKQWDGLISGATRADIPFCKPYFTVGLALESSALGRAPGECSGSIYIVIAPHPVSRLVARRPLTLSLWNFLLFQRGDLFIISACIMHIKRLRGDTAR